MMMSIKEKTLTLLERDYARVHPPGAPITLPAKAWLAELAETMAALSSQLQSANEEAQHLRWENSQLKERGKNLVEVNAHRTATKRDKLAQRFAAAMLSNGCGGGQPEQLRELAEEYADAFCPESGR